MKNKRKSDNKKASYYYSKQKSNNNKPFNLDIPGFYYDKDKNRYFPVTINNHTKLFTDYLHDESKRFSMNKNNNNEKERINKTSNFNLIHKQSTMPTNALKLIISKSYLIKDCYHFSSYEDIRSNKMLIYQNKYIIYKDNALFNQFGSVISAFKPNDNNFFNKLYVNINNIPIDKIDIINNKHLALYQNWTITLMIYPSLISWLNSSSIEECGYVYNNNMINLTLTQSYSFIKHIRNPSILSIEFDWPLIKESNIYSNVFYCLIYQSFYIIKPSTEYSIKKHSNETLFITNTDLLNKIDLISVKIFNEKRFSNFIITNNDSDLWLFEINGCIFKYELPTYKAIMKIINDYISVITFTLQLSPFVYLLLTENHNLLAFDIRNNEILALYLSKHSYYIQFACDNKLWYSNPYIFFQNENRELMQYSIELYDIVNVFSLDLRKHHRLTLNSSILILELSL